MLKSLLVISLGGAAGCVARWILSNKLNGIFVLIPFGTLIANLVGCYLIGLAISYVGTHPTLAPEWRLFIITGFLGGLTTFSTFSAEVVASLQSGRLIWACATIALHVLGGLTMTFLGIMTVIFTR